MILGHERLIIILGMPHSGTTILTYILRQHPEIICKSYGKLSWILENHWLQRQESQPIQTLLDQSSNRILLKCPAIETYNAEWLIEMTPEAKFIYCYRDFDDISASWSKPTSFVDQEIQEGNRDYHQIYYNFYWRSAHEFANRVSNFRKHYHPDFIKNPQNCMEELTNWLGLSPWEFNVSMVNPDLNIKDILKDDYSRYFSHAESKNRSVAKFPQVQVPIRRNE